MRKLAIGVSVVVLLITVLIPSAPVAAQNDGNTLIYIVVWGDALWKIAARYGVSQQAIVEVNGLASPDRIYAGQQLVIPSATGGPSSSAAGAVHTVNRGEALYMIADRYDVTQQAIIAANNLLNPSLLYVGQRLTIPGAEETATPTDPPNEEETATPTDPPSEEETETSLPGRHIVQRGETLMSIARLYNVSLWTLAQHNNISNPSVLYAGQALSIPESDVDAPPVPQPVEAGGKLIVVDLSEQKTYAYENGQVIAEFIVSTGLPSTPTVTGDYEIYLRYESQRMVGPGYDLPNVPWVMYFYQGYGFHGTWWHDNFGQPMSHGCVNMKTSDALWLYNWAEDGTAVHVQP